VERQVDIRFSKLVEKQVRKIPLSIVKMLNIWIKNISEKGLRSTRKTPDIMMNLYWAKIWPKISQVK
jgi:hypothetical protein